MSREIERALGRLIFLYENCNILTNESMRECLDTAIQALQEALAREEQPEQIALDAEELLLFKEWCYEAIDCHLTYLKKKVNKQDVDLFIKILDYFEPPKEVEK